MSKMKRFEDLTKLKDLHSMDCVSDLIFMYTQELEDLKRRVPVYSKEDLVLALDILVTELKFANSRIINVIGETLEEQMQISESDVRQKGHVDGNQ